MSYSDQKQADRNFLNVLRQSIGLDVLYDEDKSNKYDGLPVFADVFGTSGTATEHCLDLPRNLRAVMCRKNRR